VTDAQHTPERTTEPSTGASRLGFSGRPGGPDEPVPRLPRGRGMRFSRPELFRIAGLTLLLVFLLVAQQPCADAASRFVTSFGDNGSAAASLPRPDTVDLPSQAGSATPGTAGGAGSDLHRYEHLRPGMTEAEIKAAIERARARSGSAATP
jgi:hypothetical protein